MYKKQIYEASSFVATRAYDPTTIIKEIKVNNRYINNVQKTDI